MRFGRRTRRFSRRSRRSFRRKSGVGRSRLRGRRFPSGRRGFRGRGRSRRGIRRGGRLSRLRRASRSTRSSGNVGVDYKRVNRRLGGANTQQFPTLGIADNAVFTVAWYIPSGGAIQRGQVVLGSGEIGPVSGPAPLNPGAGVTPLPYTLCGYVSCNLGQLPEFIGDNFSGYREYRIRSFRVTIRHRAAVNVSVAGTATYDGGRSGAEVMLVNTSKCGQFVMPYPMAQTGGTVQRIDDPWVQVENYPNHRNISLRKVLGRTREDILSMKCDATENYLVRDMGMETTAAPTAGLQDPGIAQTDMFPYQNWLGGAESGPRVSSNSNGLVQLKRRRFRWTKQWTLIRDVAIPGVAPVWVFIKNDFKRAEGIQILVKANSYCQQTLPYFTMHITAQVEFRGQGLTPAYAAPGPTDQVLFPFTNTTWLSA